MILASNGTGVLGCGMTTAVGYTAAETCAAVRAKISGATRSEFMALGGTLVACAQVPFPKPTPTGISIAIPRLAWAKCANVASSAMNAFEWNSRRPPLSLMSLKP